MLALIKCGTNVWINKFHRVFECNDVDGFGEVDLVENGGKRGGFTRARGTGDEYQPCFFLRDVREDFRMLERGERRNLCVEFAADYGVMAALREDVDAETGAVAELVGSVARTFAHQILEMPLVFTDEIERDGFGLIRRQLINRRIKRNGLEFAVSFDLKRTIYGEQKV